MTTQTILVRFADLKARGIVKNRTTLSRWIKKLGFPSGVMIGMNTRAWTEAEIEAWLAERARASAETEAPEMEPPPNAVRRHESLFEVGNARHVR